METVKLELTVDEFALLKVALIDSKLNANHYAINGQAKETRNYFKNKREKCEELSEKLNTQFVHDEE